MALWYVCCSGDRKPTSTMYVRICFAPQAGQPTDYTYSPTSWTPKRGDPQQKYGIHKCFVFFFCFSFLLLGLADDPPPVRLGGGRRRRRPKEKVCGRRRWGRARQDEPGASDPTHGGVRDYHAAPVCTMMGAVFDVCRVFLTHTLLWPRVKSVTFQRMGILRDDNNDVVVTSNRFLPLPCCPPCFFATTSVKILHWMEANPLLANKVLEGVVRVITLTGDRTGVSRTADVLFKDRHWQSIQRINCRGRRDKYSITLGVWMAVRCFFLPRHVCFSRPTRPTRPTRESKNACLSWNMRPWSWRTGILQACASKRDTWNMTQVVKEGSHQSKFRIYFDHEISWKFLIAVSPARADSTTSRFNVPFVRLGRAVFRRGNPFVAYFLPLRPCWLVSGFPIRARHGVGAAPHSDSIPLVAWSYGCRCFWSSLRLSYRWCWCYACLVVSGSCPTQRWCSTSWRSRSSTEWRRFPMKSTSEDSRRRSTQRCGRVGWNGMPTICYKRTRRLFLAGSLPWTPDPSPPALQQVLQ